MLKLKRTELNDDWKKVGIVIPEYAIKGSPKWLHFGGGNIFRVFVAGLQDRLLSEGLTDSGIAVAECFDEEVITGIYEPYDDLTLAVIMGPEGILQERVIASVTESHICSRDMERLVEIAEDPALQKIGRAHV